MRHGNYIMCEGGFIRIARGGGKSYDKKTGEEMKQYKGTGGTGHDANFINAVRSGRRSELHAEIEVSHRSTILCHQANISYRVGARAAVDGVQEAFSEHADAVKTLADMVEQLQGNGVGLSKTPFLLGPHLAFDPDRERFTGQHAEIANGYLHYEYRAPFAQEIET
jgi:hypothetical protein